MKEEKLETNCILLNRLEKLENYVISKLSTCHEVDIIFKKLSDRLDELESLNKLWIDPTRR